MLRVGLTGGLGSGKSTVAKHFRSLGAEIIEADELGRALMEPGQPVYDEIVREFGPKIVGPDQRLDRAKLAELAFRPSSGPPRLHELNAIVHPAVIAAQGDWMRQVFLKDPRAVAIIESALIFEVEREARLRGESEGVLISWRRRFDRVVAVTAPKDLRIARYVARLAPGNLPAIPPNSPSSREEKIAADARARIDNQLSDEEKAARADFVIDNSGDLAALLKQADAVWRLLLELSNYSTSRELLE